METKDLTNENLQKLIDMSNSFNEFLPNHLTFERALRDTPEDTFLAILRFSNYELFEIHEFRDLALEFIYTKILEEMPLHINENQDYGQELNTSGAFAFYAWIPIVARWRLTIGC